MKNTPKRIKYKGQIYEAVETTKEKLKYTKYVDEIEELLDQIFNILSELPDDYEVDEASKECYTAIEDAEASLNGIYRAINRL